jgi:hypothetical protein
MNKPTTCWGITQAPDGYFVMTPEYLAWLVSYLDESCNCGPHLDHADCITEVEALIELGKKA